MSTKFDDKKIPCVWKSIWLLKIVGTPHFEILKKGKCKSGGWGEFGFDEQVYRPCRSASFWSS